MDADEKPAKPDIMKERDAATMGHPRNNTGQSRSFASSRDQIVYPQNIYVPQAPPFYYRGYENPSSEWDEYPSYFNAEGMGIGSQGVYNNENPSLVYHPGYGFSPQMPYGPYSPATPPLTSVGGDAHLYSPQQFPYSGPAFYPQPSPPNMPYITSSAPVAQPDLNALASIDHQGDNMIIGPRPNYPSLVGSFGRGNFPGNQGAVGSHDMMQGFDGLRSAGIWSDWSKPSDRPNSLTPFSPAVSPQPIGAFGSFGQNVRMASQPQRSLYGSGSGSNSYGRGYQPSGFNQGSNFGSAFISSLGTNNRGWLSLENSKPRGRGGVSLCGCNGNLDIFSEQNRGPRASKPKSQDAAVDCSTNNNGHSKPTGKIHEETYNNPDFAPEYKDAKFFIIKSYSEDNVHKSIKYCVWASTPNGNRKLDAAYREAKEKQEPCPVFLFFSVNASGQFCGVAEMVGAVDFDKSVDYWQQDRWSGQFPVKWHIIKDVPNSHFRHILLENNDNKPVTNSRDTQEVKLEQGNEMLKISKNYETDMSILDDFDFYEDRQKAMQERKAKQQATLMAAGLLVENEPKNTVTLPNDIMKQMSESFAQVVCLDESRKEANAAEITTSGSNSLGTVDASIAVSAVQAS